MSDYKRIPISYEAYQNFRQLKILLSRVAGRRLSNSEAINLAKQYLYRYLSGDGRGTS